MVTVKVYLKSKRKPLLIQFESRRGFQDMLDQMNTNTIVQVANLFIHVKDVSYMEVS